MCRHPEQGSLGVVTGAHTDRGAHDLQGGGMHRRGVARGREEVACVRG
jgi:hypothetical protein